MEREIKMLEERLKQLRERLASHRLYGSFHTVDDLRAFMEAHVFAVWDFMSLLKALQRGLCCVEVPWIPSATPEARYLVNEIVLGEESDVFNGQHLSHLEIYQLAMRGCGADVEPLDDFIKQIRNGVLINDALAVDAIPAEARTFVRDTFTVIAEGKLHTAAAAFTFGREDLIPDMFRGFVRDLNRKLSGNLDTFIWYLERHIEVDGDEHGPMALKMIASLCGDDATKWAEVEQAAVFALESRLRLWDGIADRISA